ncbi:tetraspanin-33 [Lingula anatina]|uniref:Tetraspanin n=1 Tax=Lingula anatina TaxID=7574 RepID=A0A1S3IGY5_LINAN|nr:tetraspanin-33 [Lingula anatina]XP_013397126.1 tetraspanin-33 [Lingula anatina]|eukprot:XP_013397125.1 tetraspanin-33 [Lingula anatina]
MAVQRLRSEPRGRRRIRVDHISPVVKYVLFWFNFMFWVGGALLAGLGAWVLIEKEKKLRDVLDFFFDPAIIMCAAGCIIFVLAFFGCIGALRENLCLLQTFHYVLTILLVIQLLLGAAVFIFYYVPGLRQHMQALPDDDLKHAIIKYRDDLDLRDLIDNIQKQFECCGVSNSDEGYKDWVANMYFNCSDTNPSVERCGVPASCCKMKPGEMINVMCGFDTTNKPKRDVEHLIYTRGCLKGFGSWLETHSIIIGAVSLGVIIPQFLGICLARTFVEQVRLQVAQWKH